MYRIGINVQRSALNREAAGACRAAACELAADPAASAQEAAGIGWVQNQIPSCFMIRHPFRRSLNQILNPATLGGPRPESGSEPTSVRFADDAPEANRAAGFPRFVGVSEN